MGQQNNQLNQIQRKPKFSVAINTKPFQQTINNVLQDPDRARRFTAAITSAVGSNPALQECDPASILSGALLGESLNLSPSPQLGQYYLVPFNDRKSGTKKATFILGYKGYLQLALRSGRYTDLDVVEVREGEYCGRDPETAKPRFHFIEDDDERDELPVIGYMAYFKHNSGFIKTMYWTKEHMMNHADRYSKAFSRAAYEKIQAGEIPQSEMRQYSSYWYTDFDGMAMKTMIRQLISRWGEMSIDMMNAIEKDDQVLQTADDGLITIEESATSAEIEPNDEVPAEEEKSAPAAAEPEENDEVPPFYSDEDAPEQVDLETL